MANMDVAPQVPTKIIRKYQLSYVLKNGDFQQLAAPSAAQEGLINAATDLLGQALSPTSSVSEIHIDIGNNKDSNG